MPLKDDVDFECPDCGEPMGELDRDIDDPKTFVCNVCDWTGPDMTPDGSEDDD